MTSVLYLDVEAMQTTRDFLVFLTPTLVQDAVTEILYELRSLAWWLPSSLVPHKFRIWFRTET
jgi:hypothetical protein